jgi:hypothetical protein
MPDLAELAAQAKALPLNKFSPVKVRKPQQLNVEVQDFKPSKGSTSQIPQICFFAIPLIMIVAFFVFSLFLPILVFLFNLYFLLAFKLCIPPSIKIDGGLKSQLDALPPGVDVDVGLSVSVATNLNKALQAGVSADAAALPNQPPPPVPGDLAAYSNAALLPLGNRMEGASDAPADQGDTFGVDVTGSLQYEVPVEMPS